VSVDLASHISLVARRLLGEPNKALSSRQQLRFGTNGSVAVEIDGVKRGTWYDHENETGGGVLDLIHAKTGLVDGAASDWLYYELGIRQPAKSSSRIVSTYDYTNEDGELLYQVCRLDPKSFRQRKPDGTGGWTWSVKGVRQVLYRLPEVIAASDRGQVFVVEGEKDADTLCSWGFYATCNSRRRWKMAQRIRAIFSRRRGHSHS